MPEIIEEKIIEILTKESVVVLTKKMINLDGIPQQVGKDERSSYGNWASDRERLIRDEPKDIVDTIFTLWGDTPTVEEPVKSEETDVYAK